MPAGGRARGRPGRASRRLSGAALAASAAVVAAATGASDPGPAPGPASDPAAPTIRAEAAPAETASAETASAASDERRVAAFDELHRQLARFHPSIALKGIDWTAVGDELRPAALAAADDDAFAVVLERLVARLQDGGARLVAGARGLPPVRPRQFGPGIGCLVAADGRLVVHHVTPGGAADAEGIAPGDVIVSIDGTPALDVVAARELEAADRTGFSSPRALRRSVLRSLFRAAEPVDSWTVAIEDAAGRRREVELFCVIVPPPPPRTPVAIGRAPGHAGVDSLLVNDILWIAMRRLDPQVLAELDRRIAAAPGAQAVVLDLRGTEQGRFDRDTAFMTFDRALPADERPEDRPLYGGPLALLVDEGTAGPAERFVSWFRATGRGRIYGTTTAGRVSGEDTMTLDVLDGRWSVTFPSGAPAGFLDRPIEGRGIVPDVIVRPAAADIRRGQDSLLLRIERDLSQRTS